MTIVAITGGRDRTPTLAELERFETMLLDVGATVVRHGDAHGTDKAVAAWVRRRGLADVDPWPADWDRLGRSAGPRAMLDGDRGALAADRTPCSRLISFDGGRGTSDCREAAYGRGLAVLRIHAVEEPRPWNRHHGKAPGPEIYCGRGSPLGNPWPKALEPGETDEQAAKRILGLYRKWLWERIQPDSPNVDVAALGWLRALTPAHYVVCSCWPGRCHVEMVIRAWRWLQKSGNVRAHVGVG